MIILDASVLIAHLDGDDPNHPHAEVALADTAGHGLAANSVTLAEVLVGPVRAGRSQAARAALRDLRVDEIPIPAGAAARLAELRVQTGLKLPDCCVLLAAEQVRADVVLTFDQRLEKRARELGFPGQAGNRRTPEQG